MRAPAGGLQFVPFQLPTLVDRAPWGGGWVHEIKYDGYRTQLVVDRGTVRAYTRNGYDWTERYRVLADAAQGLDVRSAVIDGEAVVPGASGLPDFQALRGELAKGTSSRVVLQAFDLLHLDGRDLREAPLVERKAALRGLLGDGGAPLLYAEHLEEDAETVYEHACRIGIEGVVSKRPDSPYRSGRQESWLKRKCRKSDSFPIVAFVEKLGAHPRRIASLYLGRQEGGKVVYAGKAESGFRSADLYRIREVLDPLITETSPLAVPVDKPKATWVRPLVHAEVQYTGMTDAGLLRQAVFKGLRPLADLPAGCVYASQPAPGPSQIGAGVEEECIRLGLGCGPKKRR